MTLRGKVVVMTGASSGIGRAAAIRFAARGACVVLAARRVEALEETALECRVAGGRAVICPTDVSSESAVQVGINRGFALACGSTDGQHHVAAFLSALDTPIVQKRLLASLQPPAGVTLAGLRLDGDRTIHRISARPKPGLLAAATRRDLGTCGRRRLGL